MDLLLHLPYRPTIQRHPLGSSAKKFLAERAVKYESLAASDYSRQVDDICSVIVECLVSERKIIAFGNGGSAALAMHFTGELVGRFLADRAPLPAICLSGDTSALTAIGNDYTYEEIFARQTQAHGRAGDVALGLSTSGKSANVVFALERADALGLVSVAMTGGDGGPASQAAKYAANVPSNDTDFIQEAHEAALHYICHRIDEVFTNDSKERKIAFND